MSHSIEMSIALNTAHEVKVCEDVLKELKNFPQEYKDVFGQKIVQIESSVSELLKFAESMDGLYGDSDNGIVKYQLKLDSIKKQINNIKSINLSKYISVMENKDSSAINEIVTQNGIMATIAIQQLEEKAIDLNVESLNKEIDEIRTKKDGLKSLAEENKRIEDYIFDNDFPPMIEEHLLELVNGSSSPQLLMDLYALMGYMDTDRIRVNELYKDVTKIFKTIGFIENNSEDNISNKSEFSKTVSFKNKLNKEFKMTFTSKGIDYKMGNYDKHLCESDSENFMEILKKDFTVSNVRIIRNQSNSRPMLKQMKNKEKEL